MGGSKLYVHKYSFGLVIIWELADAGGADPEAEAAETRNPVAGAGLVRRMHDFVCGSPIPRWPAKAVDISRVETSERRVRR